MNILYFEPLSRGWDRMKKALFQPFDLNKWFVVGFTAFLAGLLDGPGGGGGGGNKKWDGFHDLDDIADFPSTAWDWLMNHPGWFSLILFGLIFFVALAILLIWLSSRGKFMFLDNVVHDKAQITKPWYQYKKQGDSLFLWRLVYGFICLAAFIAMLIFFFGIILSMFHGDIAGAQKVSSIIGMVLLFLTFILITGYISLFLNDFVVPIMYKYNLTAIKAWNRFLPLFTQHFLYFVLYGIIIFLLIILVVICVILFGLLTCCIGFLLLIIPYIGSVVTLPISYTYRAFSLEFLEQFGPEFTFFPKAEETSTDNPAQQ
ncbi:MAG: hypothetical protein KAX05_06950 [Bacteroidales bacterium]|nr:hypothetical protein [Bacteroidales bacterium]